MMEIRRLIARQLYYSQCPRLRLELKGGATLLLKRSVKICASTLFNVARGFSLVIEIALLCFSSLTWDIVDHDILPNSGIRMADSDLLAQISSTGKPSGRRLPPNNNPTLY